MRVAQELPGAEASQRRGPGSRLAADKLLGTGSIAACGRDGKQGVLGYFAHTAHAEHHQVHTRGYEGCRSEATSLRVALLLRHQSHARGVSRIVLPRLPAVLDGTRRRH